VNSYKKPDIRPEQMSGAISGHSLLHRVKWQQFGTFGDVFKKYIRYIHVHYGLEWLLMAIAMVQQ